jgi:PKD repeat protein
MNLTSTGALGRVISVQTFSDPLIVRSRVKPSHIGGTYTIFQRLFDSGSKRITCTYADAGTFPSKYRVYDTAESTADILGDAADTWHIQDVYWIASNNVKFYINNDNYVTITSNVPTIDLYLDFGAGATGGKIYADWVFTHVYASTEPTVSAWGSAEFTPYITVTAAIDDVIPDSGYTPLLVTFKDGSTSNNCTIDSWDWVFGDTFHGYVQNPQHTYLTSGVYSFDLTVGNTTYNIYDGLNWAPGVIHVYTNTDAPVADFTSVETCGDVSDTFYFIDFSTGGGLYSWNWSFGEGNYSELRNPTHQYSANGTYNVTLFVEGAYGNDTLTKTDYITIPCSATPTPTPTPAPDPVADFTSNITVGCSPVVVMFTSTSTGTAPLTYDWDICGDYYDTPTVERVFTTGSYTISLNVSNALGYDEEIKTNYISVLNCGGGNWTPTPTPTPTPTATPPPSSNETGIFNISESHGATWIRWAWEIPSNYTSTNYTYLRVMVDDNEKYNMSMVDAGERTTEHTISDLNSNEYHKLELRYISLANPQVEYVVASDESIVKTDSSLGYYLLVFVVAGIVFVMSLFIRNQLTALVMCSFSSVLLLYLTVVSTKSNITLSVLSLILAIVTLFIVIYLLYGLYKKHVLKEVTDV